jgi:hypothetical protein
LNRQGSIRGQDQRKCCWRGEIAPIVNGTPRKLGVEKVRTERPQDYLKIVASVMPKRMEVEDVGPPLRAADLSDDELAAIIGRAKRTVV